VRTGWTVISFELGFAVRETITDVNRSLRISRKVRVMDFQSMTDCLVRTALVSRNVAIEPSHTTQVKSNIS